MFVICLLNIMGVKILSDTGPSGTGVNHSTPVPVRSEFKLIRDTTIIIVQNHNSLLVKCQTDSDVNEDLIKNEGARVLTTFNINFSDILRAATSAVLQRIWSKSNPIPDMYVSLFLTNPGRFGPGSFRPESFRPGSFRPILGVGRFGLGRWVVSANFLGGSIRP